MQGSEAPHLQMRLLQLNCRICRLTVGAIYLDSVTEVSQLSDAPQVLGGLRGASDPPGRLRKLGRTADGLGPVPSLALAVLQEIVRWACLLW